MSFFSVGWIWEMFRYLKVRSTRLLIIIHFWQKNVIKKKEFSLKQRLQVNKHLKSRKSWSSSEGNCSNSIWEAAGSLLIHTSSSPVVCRRHYASSMCQPYQVFQERHSLSWIHVDSEFPQFCPDKSSRLQVEKKSGLAAWSPQGTALLPQHHCADTPHSQPERWQISKTDFIHTLWRYAHTLDLVWHSG